MGFAVRFYETFRDLGQEKAALLAEFAEHVESRRAATSEELKETELRLRKEVETVRFELQKEIETLRFKLQKEIESVRLEIEKTKNNILKWMVVFWAGQIAAWTGILIGVLKWFLG